MKRSLTVICVLIFIAGCSANRVDESALKDGVRGFSVHLLPNDTPGIIDPEQRNYVGFIVSVDDRGGFHPTLFQTYGVRKGFMDSVYETYTRARPIMGFRAGFFNNLKVPTNQNGAIRLIFTAKTDFILPNDAGDSGWPDVAWYYCDYDWINRHFDLRGRRKVEDMNLYYEVLKMMIAEDARWSNQVR